jgi:hypothetical protein
MGTREEVTLDAIAKERDTDREATAETGRTAVQRRRWRQSASAWCGAAVGLAVELAAVAHHRGGPTGYAGWATAYPGVQM